MLDVYDAPLAELSSCVVVSDANGYDRRWLQRLCDAAGCPMPFDIDNTSIVLPGSAARAGIGVHVAVARYIAATHSDDALIEHSAGADAARLMRTLIHSVPKHIRQDRTKSHLRASSFAAMRMVSTILTELSGLPSCRMPRRKNGKAPLKCQSVAARRLSSWCHAAHVKSLASPRMQHL